MIKVVMVGPDASGHGGIASVVTTLLGEESLTAYGVEYVATWSEGGACRRFAAFCRGLARVWVLAGDCPIVHVHVASRGSFARKVVVLAAARHRGARTVLHLHGAEFHTFASRAPLFVRWLVRWAFTAADLVVVLSPVWQERVARFAGRTDSVVLPNPVTIPRLPLRVDASPVVLFLGRLGRRKGVDELIQAIATVQSQGTSGAKWILAGDGDLNRYREMASQLPEPGAVDITGWVSRDEVGRLLAESTIFCLPSYEEGKPVALLEAMAMGLACVATPVGGIPDLIQPGVTGLLVDVGDTVGLARALQELLNSRELCLQLGARARELVAAEYDAHVVGAALIRLYDQLIASADRPEIAVETRE